jgi:hypothetical protein
VQEVLVIVGSILLALAADAWWDGAQQRRAELELLSDLRTELAANRAEVEDRWILAHEQVLFASINVLLRMHGASPSLLADPPQGVEWADPNSSRWYSEVMTPLAEGGLESTSTATNFELGAILRTPSYQPSIASFDVLFAAGGLARLHDAELRAQLARLPTLLEDIEDEEVLVRTLVYDHVAPQLAQAAPDVTFPSAVFPMQMEQWAPPGVAHAERTLRPNSDLARSMAKRVQLEYVLLQALADAALHFGALLEAIESELE